MLVQNTVLINACVYNINYYENIAIEMTVNWKGND